MEEELRDKKAQKDYYNMETVDEEDTYDYLLGKRYFICKDFENDGLHFRQPWVTTIHEEVDRLKERYHEQAKLLRECQALKSNMGDEVDRRLYAVLDEAVDEYIEDTFNNIVENRTFKPRKHAYVERNREEGHNRLWNDYFSEDSTFSAHLFRRRFRMNKEVFLRIINHLSKMLHSFKERRDAVEG
uniref:Uncharacterized protein n=1 Tax=Brassica oleracea TaxID=3712 RepID=A0A3P6F2Y4_BRAOL|nr:unnamed protein product [Brassica oleracea]